MVYNSRKAKGGSQVFGSRGKQDFFDNGLARNRFTNGKGNKSNLRSSSLVGGSKGGVNFSHEFAEISAIYNAEDTQNGEQSQEAEGRYQHFDQEYQQVDPEQDVLRVAFGGKTEEIHQDSQDRYQRFQKHWNCQEVFESDPQALGV